MKMPQQIATNSKLKTTSTSPISRVKTVTWVATCGSRWDWEMELPAEQCVTQQPLEGRPRLVELVISVTVTLGFFSVSGNLGKMVFKVLISFL